MRCPGGAIVDVIVDLRPESPTYLEHVAVELSAENSRSLYVPRRFGHGYQVLEDVTETSYIVSEFYSPEPRAGCGSTIRPWRSPGRCRRATCRTRIGSGPLLAEVGDEAARRMRAG